MIRVSILYPNADDARFDMAYYRDHHMKLVQERLGSACKAVAIDQGLGGPAPGSKPAYVVMCHLSFDDLGTFQKVFPPHAQELTGDIPNFTNTHPVIQISEVRA